MKKALLSVLCLSFLAVAVVGCVCPFKKKEKAPVHWRGIVKEGQHSLQARHVLRGASVSGLPLPLRFRLSRVDLFDRSFVPVEGKKATLPFLLGFNMHGPFPDPIEILERFKRVIEL